jgi:hypothetical protein
MHLRSNFTCGHPAASKDQLLKEKDPKVGFHLSAIKPKFCGWLFHAWTQICKRKEMIHKGWGQTGLL